MCIHKVLPPTATFLSLSLVKLVQTLMLEPIQHLNDVGTGQFTISVRDVPLRSPPSVSVQSLLLKAFFSFEVES